MRNRAPSGTYQLNVWLYLAVNLALTWLFWIPAALQRMNGTSYPVGVLIAAGVIVGTALPPLIHVYLTKGTKGLHDYWQRLVGVRRISWRWYAVIALTFPLFSALGILTDILLGGTLSFKIAEGLAANPATIVQFATCTLIYGPLPEELNWRGHVLDALQARWNALWSSVILGLVWAVWHLPLFFIEDTYQHDKIGLFTLNFWLVFFLSGFMAVSVFMTWIYNNTNRSTLSAILAHFMLNFTGEFLNLSDRAELYRAMWTVLGAMAVIYIWGPNTLFRSPRVLTKGSGGTRRAQTNITAR